MSTSTTDALVWRRELLVAVLASAACHDDVPPAVGSTSSSSSGVDPSTSGEGTDVTLTATGTTSAATTGTTSSSSGSETAGSQCLEWSRDPTPTVKIALVVDTSASMLDPVHIQGQPPIDPWAATIADVADLVTRMSDDPEARAEFALRLMPGPVGGDVCGHSDALDLDGWVSGQEVLDQLAQVEPQGGRAMRRALEGVPADADLVVVLAHGAPGCGDDVDPEAFDGEVATTIIDEGTPAILTSVVLPPGPAPVKADTEPDGIDPFDALLEIGTAIDTTQWCHYDFPLFPADSAYANLIDCLYGNRVDPCSIAVPPHGAVEDALVWVGGDPIPRLEACGAEPGWAYTGLLFGSDYWMLTVCTAELCRQYWDEGGHVVWGCEPDTTG